MTGCPWYILSNEEQTDSPALLVFPDRIARNINEMIRIAGSPERLIPHVKTHKMSAIVKMHLKAGIVSFKCATIAEGEILAQSGAKKILLAYQLNKTKIFRLLQLIKRFKKIRFASLVDNALSAQILNDLFKKGG